MINRLTRILFSLSLVSISLFFTACSDDGTADPTPTFASTMREFIDPIEGEIAEIEPTSALQRFIPTPSHTPEPTPPPSVIPPDTDTATPRPTHTPTKTSTLRPTTTSTPLPPSIVVRDQVVQADGELTIDDLFVSENVWLTAESLGEVVTVTALSAGDAADVTLTIDPYTVGDDITFAIYRRTDAPFDAEDTPVLLEQTVRATFDMRFPGIFAADQFVDQDGILTVNQVEVLEDSWLTVYTDIGEETNDFLVDSARLGEIIGTKFITAGAYTNIQMPIKWQEASERLNVVLHRDNGRLGRFDPVAEFDPLITVRNAPVGLRIGVTYRPWVTIINQPVINNRIEIDYARVNDPAWLAIWRDDGTGFIYTVIGFTQLEPGINRNLTIPLIQGLATDKMFAQVFIDVDEDGEFDFPGIDQPRRQYGEDRLFEFRTDEGATLVASDQTIELEQESVTIERVVSPVNTFVAVYADSEGRPGELLGETWVPAGISRDLSVPVNRDEVTSLVHALLYADYGTARAFEPELDPVLERDGFPISSPFGIKFTP